MFAMLGQIFRGKLPFATVYDDRMACRALELVGQFFFLILAIILILVEVGFKGYVVSATFSFFYLIFMMGLYLSVANAWARKEMFQKLIDTSLFAFGVFSFVVYISGNTTLNLVCQSIFWGFTVCRYIFFIVLDWIALEKKTVQIGDVTVKKE